MRIYWLRVLLGGFLIEVVLAIVLLGGFAAAGVDISKGISTASALIIGVGCFAVAFLIVLWLGRGMASHVVLNGFLMGWWRRCFTSALLRDRARCRVRLPRTARRPS